VVELQLLLLDALVDFEGLDLFAPQFSATALQLVDPPIVLGPALPPAPADIAVFAPPTLAQPKIGISNINPGIATLDPGLLATYRFRILALAAGSSATVTIPWDLDEVPQTALTAQISVPSAPIPEPTTYIMLLAGLSLLAWAAKCKDRNA
jgi:hypothetical protein